MLLLLLLVGNMQAIQNGASWIKDDFVVNTEPGELALPQCLVGVAWRQCQQQCEVQSCTASERYRELRAASAFSLATLQSEQSQVENCALLAEPVPSTNSVCVWKTEGGATALDTYPVGRERKVAQTLFNISKNVIKMRHFFQHLGHKNNEIFISSFRRMSQCLSPIPVHPT